MHVDTVRIEWCYTILLHMFIRNEVYDSFRIDMPDPTHRRCLPLEYESLGQDAAQLQD